MFLAGFLCRNSEGKLCLEMPLSPDNKAPEKVEITEILDEFLNQHVLIRVDLVELK